MSGRSFNNSNYRYGFNGKEIDKDINEGTMDYGARIYDTRLGRFFSMDPHKAVYSSQGPYNGFYNNPIMFLDGDGRDNIIYIVNMSSGRPDIDITKAADELQNAVDAILGCDKVQVVVLQREDFDATNLDATDVVLAYGDVVKLKSFVLNDVAKKKGTIIPGQFLDGMANHEETDPNLKLGVVIDSKISNFQIDNNYDLRNKEAYTRPGNSPQEWLVLTFLHSIGHIATGGGHSDEGLELNVTKSDVNDDNDIYKQNFLSKGETILNTVSRFNSWDNSFVPNKNYELKHGLDYTLKDFKSYTFAGWNKHVFGKPFGKLFSGSKPSSRMVGRGHTTYMRGNSIKVVNPRFK